ncbi:ankyrin repeat domain-containing protein [bacterium]|nr:ankyrin repeat domain-containing protein [bacterium]
MLQNQPSIIYDKIFYYLTNIDDHYSMKLTCRKFDDYVNVIFPKRCCFLTWNKKSKYYKIFDFILRKNDFDGVKYVIDHCYEKDEEMLSTALRRECRDGYYDICKYLIEKYTSNITQCNNSIKSNLRILFMEIISNYKDTRFFDLFINWKDACGRPLFYPTQETIYNIISAACWNDNSTLEKIFDICHKEKLAIDMSQCFECFEILINYRKGCFKNIKLFLDRGNINLTYENNGNFMSAIKRGYIGIVKLFLDYVPPARTQQLDPTFDNDIAFRTAVKGRYYDIAEMLLNHIPAPGKNRVNATACKNQAMVQALYNFDFEFVRVLERWEGPLDENNNPKKVPSRRMCILGF